MRLTDVAFGVTDWALVPATVHEGEPGTATWRTQRFGDVRVRMVEYSPGYVSNHWCDKGHILLVLSGGLVTELADGRVVPLPAGSSYQVGDGVQPHRSSAPEGARLFVVD
jgi:hypothetical protein